MSKNYYDILGVAQSASRDQVRERFRELTRQRHPDHVQGDAKGKAEEEFQAITEAFNVLYSPERRRQHDMELSRPTVRTQSTDTVQVAKMHLQQGARAYKEGRHDEAAQSFERATKVESGNARAWHHLALASSHDAKQTARAIAAITRACQLDRMNVNYLKLAGRIFQSAGRTERAIHYYNEALKWGGGDRDVERRLEQLQKPAKKSMLDLFGKGD